MSGSDQNLRGTEQNTSCEWFEASIAASLYESLPENEQSRLVEHLAACAVCRQTEVELRQLTAALPAGPQEIAVDLWPELQARIETVAREHSNTPARGRFHWSLYAAAAVALVVVGANIARLAPASPMAAQSNPVVASAVQQSLERAKGYSEKHDFAQALKELEGTLAANPNDPDAGAAQLALAELEFNHGQRYAEAYEAYATLKSKYPASWTANPRNADRFDLLSEAKQANFEPLYALNAARNGSDAFAQLERIAARPDSCLVAALAVDAMRELVGGADANTGEGKVAALEKVRERCKDPVAAAQIKMALAEVHWKDLHDTARARDLYGEVAQAPQPMVAQAARAALAKLEANH